MGKIKGGSSSGPVKRLASLFTKKEQKQGFAVIQVITPAHFFKDGKLPFEIGEITRNSVNTFTQYQRDKPKESMSLKSIENNLFKNFDNNFVPIITRVTETNIERVILLTPASWYRLNLNEELQGECIHRIQTFKITAEFIQNLQKIIQSSSQGSN